MQEIVLETWKEENQRRFSGKEVRRILGVRTRDTLIKDREAAGIIPPYTLPKLVEILKVRLYLNANTGVHSRESYKRLRNQPKLLELKFRSFGISIEEELMRILKNANHA